MNARHILFCLALSLLGTGLQAQSDLPQVFSPNAAELGKYGKIPVSYFNGLPNISIPLTELRAKGYTLPIYLTYHAGGNKPDQHPGWVGLGWTLHAGGCINRIINGMKDEMDAEENAAIHGGSGPLFNPGYYWHSEETQREDWSDLEGFDTPDNAIYQKDHAPDEFQINVDGLQASFYIMSQDSVAIVSKSPVSFKVEIGSLGSGKDFVLIQTTPGAFLRAHGYHYFKSFTITKEDGTVYHFGGNDNALEYSIRCQPNPNNNYVENDSDRFVGGITANTWYLTRIDYPNGEKIYLEYAKDKLQIVRSAAHRMEYYFPVPEAFPPFTYNTKGMVPPNYYASYLLARPSYLRLIRSEVFGDSLLFNRTETQELKESYNVGEFQSCTSFMNGGLLTPSSYQCVLAEDSYFQLTSICSPRDSFSFSYTHSDSTRLKLQSVTIHDGLSGASSYQYSLHYNKTELPSYGSKQTDLWGFYNGKDHSSVSWDNMESFRTPNDSLMKAEILTQIDYPTGGYTIFEYEPHTYRRVAHQYPFYVETLSSDDHAGGLRIKRIHDEPITGTPETRTFLYLNNGISSGILSGWVSNYEEGEQIVDSTYSGSLEWASLHTGLYKLGSENPIRPLSTTDGCHVSYSEVTEQFADGSYRVHHFSNHDSPFGLDHGVVQPLDNIDEVQGKIINQPISSMELFRGLEVEVSDYRADHTPVRIETITFRKDTTNYVKSFEINNFCANRLLFAGYSKTFTDWPYMQNKTITNYPDDGGSPHTEITEYTYDSHRRLTETKRTVGGVTERETFSYTGNYSAQPYAGMKAKNMISYPVEHMKYRMDAPSSELLVSAELTTWREGPGGRYVPSAKYLAELGPGVLPSNFTPYATTDNVLIGYPAPEVIYSRTDSLGNILESVSRDGVHSAYLWNKSGVYPEMVARNANRKEFRTVNHSEEGVLDYMISEGPTNPIETFVITGPGTLILDLGTTAGQDWGITLEVTGVKTVALGSHGIQENVNNALEDYVNASSHAFIPLPAGSHSVCILEAVNYFSGGDPEEEAPELEYTLTWDTETVTGYDDVFHEDFEPDTVQSGASQVGFHSYGYYTGGNYTFELDTDPDKQYILDYRIKQNNGAWQYVRSNLTYSANGNYTIQVGTAKLDEVRVYPADSEAESYTWDAAGNLLSKTDARGVTESYEYDGLGRLVFIRDNDGNYVGHYEYNYQNR